MSLLLSSCSWPDESSEKEAVKQDFFIETRKFSELSSVRTIKKIATVRSGQDIKLSSLTNGRVATLLVKKWQSVQAWQPIAYLTDTLGNISISAARAQNALERAQINRDQSILSLDKQLFDIDIQMENLERSILTLESDSEANIRNLQNNFNNTNLQSMDSASQLQLAQFDANLERQKLDYETKLVSDNQTRQSFIDFFTRDENALRVLVDNVIDFADPIFWVSEKNRFANTRFETYLGAKNTSQKAKSETLLKELINFRESSYFSDFRQNFIGSELSDEQILAWFEALSEGYEILRTILPEINETFINSIESVGQLSSAELQAWKWQIQGYQTAFQGNYASYIQTSNQALSFLRTYKNIQESQKRSLELQEQERAILLKNLESWSLGAEVGLDRTLIGIEDQKESLQTQLKQLRNTKENLIASREVQLRSLDNAIKEAQISLRQANLELQKLTITAPISGTIGETLVDVGQELQAGTPVVQILSKGSSEVEISLTQAEKELISLQSEVFIDVGAERYPWRIYAISDVAGANLNYSATVLIESDVNLLGTIVEVVITLETDALLLPLRLIETSWESIGRITTFSGGTLESVRVRLGNTYGDQVEIVSCAQNCEDLDIVWNDTSNYTPANFILKEKNSIWKK